MKILYQPARSLSHSCSDGLWQLGPRPAGTLVACICGRRWQAEPSTFWRFIAFRLWTTQPMKRGDRFHPELTWRLHSCVVIEDWDDVPGQDASAAGGGA